MRGTRWIVLGLLLVCGVALSHRNAAAQQTGTVTGQVTDSVTTQPLVGAQIIIVGTNVGGLTDQNGRYLLNRVPVGQRQVRVVLIGFGQKTSPVTVSASGTATADFALTSTAIPLEAMVVSAVTGREQRSRELGSKVADIDVKDINPATVTSVADVLGGRAEGVIMQDVNGTTGTSQRIRIRGANSLSLSNEPLVYVDGVQINSDFGGSFGVGGQEPSRLNDINPNDIENVEIVKGPAASALYGTAAANGVILITTKRGRPGTTEWTAFAETGQLDDVTDYPMNYLTYQIDDASQPLFNPETGRFNTKGYSYCPNISAADGKCTQDGTLSFNTLTDPRTKFFSTGMRRRYGGSVRGGTETVRYFVSTQLSKERGVIDFNTEHQANFRGNLDAKLSDNSDLSISFGYAGSQLALNNNDNSIFSPILNGLVGEGYYIPPSDANPDQVNTSNYGFGFNLTQLRYLRAQSDVDRYTTGVNLKWRPTSWLSMNANGGLDLSDINTHEVLQPGLLPIAESYTKGYRQSRRANHYVYQANVSGVSTFQLREDVLSTTTVGGSYTRDNNENTYCYGSSLVPGTASCGTTAALFSINENFFEIRTLGFYAQQQFSWRDKVFMDGSVRGDDDSAFGSDLGFTYYPGASLSWVLGEEEWFPKPSWLSNLRLRTAWGTSGLRPGFRNAVTLYNPTTVASDAGDEPGVTLRSTGNTQLKPERTTEYETGFDTGFFGDRIGLEFTYFHKRSKDALISRQLPGSLGLTQSVYDNLGSVRNSGTEVSAHFAVLQTKNLGLDLNLTNTTVANKVESLGQGVEDIVMNRGLQRHKEGYSAAAFFQPTITYDDADHNGLLSIDEVTVGDTPVFMGVSIPKWQRTIGANLRLFDWITVSTLFEGRGGNMTGNDSESFRCGFRSTRGCPAIANPNASLEEQARAIADRYLGSSAGYIEKADFYKWRELSITLDVPQSLTSRIGQLNGLRLTLAGRNLATFTDYTGLDPETVEGGGNANFSQSEFNTQPPVRQLTLRVDYRF